MAVGVDAARIERLARAHGGKLVVVAIPFLVALTNATWLTNGMGDVDSWSYNGYFAALGAFAKDRAAWGPANYFETRLPVIVPGALVHGVLPDAVARVVLNLGLLHGAIALSFSYVLSKHLSRSAATLGAVLLVTDIFYLRSIGWDYVDNAALAYQAVTFALLAHAPAAKRPALCIAAAGFTAASMVAVHLSSVAMLPVLAAYALFVAAPLTSRRELLLRVRRLAGWSSVGAVACLVLYGLISRYVLSGPFLFFVEQVRASGHVDTAHYSAKARILGYGYWLSMHAAVLVASVIALLLHHVRRHRRRLEPFAVFCLWSSALLYALLVVGDLQQRTIYMARSGLYATNLLLLAYFTVAVLLFRARELPSWAGAIVVVAFPCITMVKLALHDGLGLTLRFSPPMIAIAAAMVLALVVGSVFRGRAWPTMFATALLCACSLFVPRRFERDDAIVAARDIVLANGTPPRVFFSESDPQRSQLVSIASALTDHVVHDHYAGAGGRPLRRGDRVAVLESTLAREGTIAPPCVLPPATDGLRPTGHHVVRDRYLDIAIHLFEVTQDDVRREDIRCVATATAPVSLALHQLSGARLSGSVGAVEGDTRAARAGASTAGYLTEGPGVALPAGSYRVVVGYAATGAQHSWDIIARDGSETRRIAQALLPDTAGKPGSLEVSFRLPEPVSELQVRTAFAGTGELVVRGVTIESLYRGASPSR